MSSSRASGGSLIGLWLLGVVLLGFWIWMTNTSSSECTTGAQPLGCFVQTLKNGVAPYLGWLLVLYGAVLVLATGAYIWRRTTR